MTSNKIGNWNVLDRNSNIELDEILPLSERASSLVARSVDAPILQVGLPNVLGAVEMMRALDYHYANFMAHFQQLGATDAAYDCLDHEAVAYINHVGQFCSFSKSTLVQRYIKSAAAYVPKINELMVFRNKHTAHRAIDVPYKDDTADFLKYYGGSMGLFSGRVWQQRDGHSAGWLAEWLHAHQNVTTQAELDREHAKRCYLIYQTAGVNGPVYFCMEQDHESIIKQAFELISVLVGPHPIQNPNAIL